MPHWYIVLPVQLFVPEYSEKYAKAEDIEAAPDANSSEEEMSEDEYNSSDDAMAGKADP